MIRMQDIERIARAEYRLEITALPPDQKNIIYGFFDHISIELFRLFPLNLNILAKYTTHEDINAYQQKQLAALLNKIQTYQYQLSPQLWKSCLGILSIYINSQDFPGAARYRSQRL